MTEIISLRTNEDTVALGGYFTLTATINGDPDEVVFSIENQNNYSFHDLTKRIEKNSANSGLRKVTINTCIQGTEEGLLIVNAWCKSKHQKRSSKSLIIEL